MSSIAWGPFDDPVDAANNLGKFTDQVLDPQFGIAWIGNNTLYTLRGPTYDANGDGNVVTFEYRDAPPPPPPPSGFGGRVVAWIKRSFELQGEMELENSRIQMEGAQAFARGISTLYQRAMGTRDRQLDTVGIVLDGVAIGFSLVLLSFGPLEVLGVIGLIGGAALLLADGSAYLAELAGADETSDEIKSATFYPRCLFALMTLPDAAWGLGKVALESAELGSKAIKAGVASRQAAAGVARNTQAAAGAADAIAASEKASRAARYAKVGEQAQRRANAARQKLAVFMGAQAGGRLTIPPGLLLLLKEKDDGAESCARMTAKIRNYTFHVAALHRS